LASQTANVVNVTMPTTLVIRYCQPDVIPYNKLSPGYNTYDNRFYTCLVNTHYKILFVNDMVDKFSTLFYLRVGKVLVFRQLRVIRVIGVVETPTQELEAPHRSSKRSE